MKLVLKENIRGLGATGDVVRVKDGYARNYLLPKGKATFPNAQMIEHLKKERTRYLEKEKDRIGAARELGDSMDGLVLTIAMKANEAGQLFGSVTEAIVAERLSEERGETYTKDQIVIGSHFKRVGEYLCTVQLHSEVEAEITLDVVAEETEEAREDRLAMEEAALEAEARAEALAAAEAGEIDFADVPGAPTRADVTPDEDDESK